MGALLDKGADAAVVAAGISSVNQANTAGLGLDRKGREDVTLADIADTECDLATTFYKLGRAADAVQLLQSSLGLRTTRLGKHHQVGIFKSPLTKARVEALDSYRQLHRSPLM